MTWEAIGALGEILGAIAVLVTVPASALFAGFLYVIIANLG